MISECIVFQQVCTIFIDFPLNKRQACKQSRSGIWGQRAASVNEVIAAGYSRAAREGSRAQRILCTQCGTG